MSPALPEQPRHRTDSGGEEFGGVGQEGGVAGGSMEEEEEEEGWGRSVAAVWGSWLWSV